ncbi:hypothetical protein HOI26_05180 [Candidatus Woesearchaeota archaeon]|jgi:hypothetical protein|nr:hypothetical protein [Candidatus Woesearchaeota archaeon]MBT5740461.1 hypothetical protein [Candidatus Woesearchaeota archaeon]
MYKGSFPHSLPVEEAYARMKGAVEKYQGHPFVSNLDLSKSKAPYTIQATARFLRRPVEGTVKIKDDSIEITGSVSSRLSALFESKAVPKIEALLS